MPPSNIGAGFAPAGVSIAGFGTPGVTDSTTIKLFIKPDRTRGNARKIDPATGDFVLDGYGLHVGCDVAQQMVLLALKTELGTAAQTDLGIDFKRDVITENTPRKAELAVQAALKSLIDRKIIELVRVEVSRVGSSGISIQVFWRDLSNGETQVIVISQ